MTLNPIRATAVVKHRSLISSPRRRRESRPHRFRLAAPLRLESRLPLTSDFTYSLSPSGAAITGYTGTETALSIPALIDGHSVTSIAASAFESRPLISITLPEGLTHIGRRAFYGNSKLVTVGLPEGLTEIGDLAFCFCTSLPQIHLPASLITIRDFGFYGCSSLQSVTLPNGFENLLWGAFRDCVSLETVTLSPSMSYITSQAFWGTNLKSIVIPASVQSIGHDVFTLCPTLTSVYFLGQPPKAGDHPFQNSTQARAYYVNSNGWGTTYAGLATSPFATEAGPFTVTISHRGISIATLRTPTPHVSIPARIGDVPVVAIGRSAFASQSSVRSVSLPEGLRTIGSQAFLNCSQLTSVSIPEGVTTVDTAAFMLCSSLTTVNLPDSVTTLGTRVFWECPTLATVSTGTGVGRYENRGGLLYDIETRELLWCPQNKQGVVRIDPFTETISTGSFLGCSQITSLDLPPSLSHIKSDAFSGCTNLQSLRFAGNAPRYEQNSLNAVAIYNRNTSGWNASLGGLTTITTPLPPTAYAEAKQAAANISWTPQSDGGSPINEYVVEVLAPGRQDWTPVRAVPAHTTTTQISGLINGLPHLFRIVARNAAGSSAPSLPTATITPLPAATSAPTARAGNGFVLLNWQKPMIRNTTPITDYSVRYSLDGGATWTIAPRTPSLNQSQRVVLPNGRPYIFQVAPFVAGGVGVYSRSSRAVMPINPSAIPAAPSKPRVNATATGVELAWDAVAPNEGGPVSDYIAQYRIDAPVAKWVSIADGVSNRTSMTIRLASARRYIFRVAAKNAAGVGEFSPISAPVIP